MKGTPVGQVENKVKAGTAAAAVSGLVLYVLGRYVFKGDVPDVVTSWTYAIIPAVLTFAAGYRARHTVSTVDVTAEVTRQLLAALRDHQQEADATPPVPAGPAA